MVLETLVLRVLKVPCTLRRTRKEMVLETLVFFAIQPIYAAGSPRRFY
jgi:hypothetical protein